MTKRIDGSALAKEMLADYSDQIKQIKQRDKTVPGLAILLVGDDKSSRVYVKMIIKKCEAVGVAVKLFTLPVEATTKQVVEQVEQLNQDAAFHGIIVQFPLPKSIDALAVRETISVMKDVDSAGTRNIGKFFAGQESFKPCTPQSMIALAKTVQPQLSGLHAVVVGRSLVVGKPVANLCLAENCTVTLCHSKTERLEDHLKRADIIMSAVGRAEMITKEMINPAAIVIDAGINVVEGGIVGDVAADILDGAAKAMTPVPGGVGPVTNAMLIKNVIEAYQRQKNNA